jgi:SAM-dependent methyltransferase
VNNLGVLNANAMRQRILDGCELLRKEDSAMSDSESIANHYRQEDLVGKILAGVERLGKTIHTVTEEDLSPVDEFHIGGRIATKSFLNKLSIGAGDHVLDIGCGIGGSSRFAALAHGCRATGVDLVKEYIQTGGTLCQWLGMKQIVTLMQGNILDLDFTDATFDKAFMLHVGMNISDKYGLMKEIGRAVKPGGVFGIYDIMRTGEGEITFPVPWASDAKSSSLSSPETYKNALTEAGFKVVSEVDRGDFALGFFKRIKAAAATTQAPPPLGLHILLGEGARAKYGNMVQGVMEGKIAPFELVAQKD